MADDIKEIKKKIWHKKNEIKNEEQGRDSWAEQLPGVNAMIETGEDVDQWKGFKKEAEDAIAGHNATLAKLQDELAALEAHLPKAPEPVAPKFDPEKHPLLRKNVEKPEPAKPVVFNVGDICEAQWTDKAWYKAKVQTILGSVSAPKYLVRFIEYDDSMTVDRDALRPLVNKRKREAEPLPADTPAVPVTSTPHVISGPASVNPNAQAAMKDAAAAEIKPKKKKTIGDQKQLEKRVNSWQSFNSKGVGKKLAKRESMFRSGTTVNSRVGFTGSGKGMTETSKRVRYNNKAEADDDADY